MIARKAARRRRAINMALVKRRVVNPSPSVLALVNPRKKRGKNMATRKRKSSKRRVHRARAHNPINPTRRRKSATRKRRSSVFARTRRHNPVNPTRRRRRIGRRRHHRNPVTGVVGRAIPLVVGSAVIAFAKQFVSPLIVRVAPQIVATPIGAAGTTFATGWAVSAVARMFSFTRRWADDLLLAGAVMAGGQIFSAYVAPMIPGAGMSGPYRGRRGMNGIGVMTNIPPGINALPPVPGNNNGMQGVGVMTAIPPGMPR